MSTPGSCGVWGPLWPSLETNLASFAPDKLTPSVVVVRLLACGTLDIPPARGFKQLSSQQSGETHAPPVSGLPTSDVAHFGGVRGAGEHDVPWTIWSGSDIPTAIGTYSPTWSEVSKVELYWTLFTAIFGGGSFFSLQNRRIHAGYIDEYSQMFGEICEIFTSNHATMNFPKTSVCKEWDWKPKVLLFHQNCEFWIPFITRFPRMGLDKLRGMVQSCPNSPKARWVARLLGLERGSVFVRWSQGGGSW